MTPKERYQNKYIRQILEERLREENFGANIHCKEDATYITIPPATVSQLYETQENVDEKEDKIVESIVKKTKLIAKEIQLDSNLDYVLHGDNIKIKLNITNDR
tara:strand:- start:808 stop:1116 length:309 start_codon:yes stop_codon:yes gene_type:complete